MLYALTYHSGPDSKGRRVFTLEWKDAGGVYRKELHRDGKPVGYRRGQVFKANPAQHIRRLEGAGCTIREQGS